jgi:hypothetical protein
MIDYILLFALVLVVLRRISLKIQAEVGQDRTVHMDFKAMLFII